MAAAQLRNAHHPASMLAASGERATLCSIPAAPEQCARWKAAQAHAAIRAVAGIAGDHCQAQAPHIMALSAIRQRGWGCSSPCTPAAPSCTCGGQWVSVKVSHQVMLHLQVCQCHRSPLGAQIHATTRALRYDMHPRRHPGSNAPAMPPAQPSPTNVPYNPWGTFSLWAFSPMEGGPQAELHLASTAARRPTC